MLLLQPHVLILAAAVGGAAGAGGAAPVRGVLPAARVAVAVGLLVEERPQLADAPVDLALDHRVAARAAVLSRPPAGGGNGGGGGHTGGHAVRRLQLPPRRRGSHLNIDAVFW